MKPRRSHADRPSTLVPAVFSAMVLTALPGAARAQSVPAQAFEPQLSVDGPRLPMPRGAQGMRYTGGPIPAGAHLERQHPTSVLLAGGGMLLLAYASSVALWNLNTNASCATDRGELCSNSPWLAVPVIGPWVALGSPTNSAEMNVALIADGVLQLAGIAFGLIGVSSSYPVVVFDTVRAASRSRSRSRPSLTAIPTALPAGAGISLAAVF